MHDLSIFGTSSDAGKSTLSFALTYLYHHRGIKVAPFKAQNVSNNAQVCDLGGEIAQPQHFAAASIGLPTESDFNPILLKSGQKNSASLIVNGQAVGEKDVHAYYRDIDTLKPIVCDAFRRLQKRFELIIAEGAGSPVELNLMQKDLSNITIAETFENKIILVADIERGGVFASIWGVYNLLPKELQKNVIGVIVNKFRGDITLFDEGISIIEEQFKLKVLGVVPYRPFNLGFEDAQSLMNYRQDTTQAILTVGVIKLPHISNFTDFEPLVADREISLEFVTTPAALGACDLIIIPGSKRVVHDLNWLREQGFVHLLQNTEVPLLGICGGYEMMFEQLEDPLGIEEEVGTSAKGLGIFSSILSFQKEKTLKKGIYRLFGCEAEGYEIHHGKASALFLQKGRCYGTFVHGLLESDCFRKKLFNSITPKYRGYDFMQYKAQAIDAFARHIDRHVDVDYIIKKLEGR